MSKLMAINTEGLTFLTELPAVVKDGEVIIPPRPEFSEPEGLQKLRSLANNLGGEVIYYKVRAKVEELEYTACVEHGCYSKANILYCEKHDRSQRSTVHHHGVAQLRPVSRAANQ